MNPTGWELEGAQDVALFFEVSLSSESPPLIHTATIQGFEIEVRRELFNREASQIFPLIALPAAQVRERMTDAVSRSVTTVRIDQELLARPETEWREDTRHALYREVDLARSEQDLFRESTSHLLFPHHPRELQQLLMTIETEEDALPTIGVVTESSEHTLHLCPELVEVLKLEQNQLGASR